jgi:uroporphyrinogen decarboxylase
VNLNHKEPDRIPFDLGTTGVTGISIVTYKKLLPVLGLEEPEPELSDIKQQLARPSEAFFQKLAVDTRGMHRQPPSTWKLELKEDEKYFHFMDEWGIGYRMPREDGHYFDMESHPLADARGLDDLEKFPWPEPCDPERLAGLKEQARALKRLDDYALIVPSLMPGVLEVSLWLRGFEDFFSDLVIDPGFACALMDKLVDLKIAYWEKVLPLLEDDAVVIREGDDIGAQNGPIVSPDIYRRYIKPSHKRLFGFVKKHAGPQAKLFLHTCGSVYELIPDLIEMGVDILNPIQVSAKDMGDTRRLKQEFGKDLVFWGGGIDTQHVLPHGSVQQIRDEVKRRIDDLAPGGGFVFATVHNIQSDVSPENVIAMWEAFQELAAY